MTSLTYCYTLGLHSIEWTDVFLTRVKFKPSERGLDIFDKIRTLSPNKLCHWWISVLCFNGDIDIKPFIGNITAAFALWGFFETK